MRILIFNWKDRRHPRAGGAERYVHEIASRLVAAGHEVTLFCAAVPGAPARDEDEGVRIVRRGGRFGVYREAVRFWRDEGAGRFDVVVDAINTRPFMTPRFVRDVPVVALIHQLAAEVWQYETPFPVSALGRHVLEPRWLRPYRDVPTVTVSTSTAEDLRRLGFRDVRIVHNGVTPPAGPLPPKEERPTLLFAGRLARVKRPGDAIEAHRVVRATIPDARLWVVGDGYLRHRLDRAAGPGVRFFGFVDEAKKWELMARAHVLLMPGVREGWGRVILEANAAGTPAVGYDVPGVRDAIVPASTGLLVPPNPASLARGIIEIIRGSHPEIGARARAWSAGFDWGHAAGRFADVLDSRASTVGKETGAPSG